MSQRIYYILVDKHPVGVSDPLVWAMFMEHGGRAVKSTIINGIHVSTVFLGLDHSFGSGEPVLFETMVFGGCHDQHQRRYCTWDEAEQGHEEVLELIRKMIDVDEIIADALKQTEEDNGKSTSDN